MDKVYVVTDAKHPYRSPVVFEKKDDADDYVRKGEMAGDDELYINCQNIHPDNPYTLIEYYAGTIKLIPPNEFGNYCNKVDYRTSYCWDYSWINTHLAEGYNFDDYCTINSIKFFEYQKYGHQTIKVIAKNQKEFSELIKQIEAEQRKFILSFKARVNYFFHSLKEELKLWFRR